jgi:GDPmannose 4,6-dehydratase
MQLGWTPQYDLTGLVQEMVAMDVDRVKKELMLKEAGFRS